MSERSLAVRFSAKKCELIKLRKLVFTGLLSVTCFNNFSIAQGISFNNINA